MLCYKDSIRPKYLHELDNNQTGNIVKTSDSFAVKRFSLNKQKSPGYYKLSNKFTVSGSCVTCKLLVTTYLHDSFANVSTIVMVDLIPDLE